MVLDELLMHNFLVNLKLLARAFYVCYKIIIGELYKKWFLTYMADAHYWNHINGIGVVMLYKNELQFQCEHFR